MRLTHGDEQHASRDELHEEEERNGHHSVRVLIGVLRVASVALDVLQCTCTPVLVPVPVLIQLHVPFANAQ